MTAVLSISCFELTVVPQYTNTNMPKTTRQLSGSAAGFNVHGWNHWNRILRIFINDIDIDNYLNCQLVHFSTLVVKLCTTRIFDTFHWL